MGSLVMDEKKGALRMTDIERRLRLLEADIKEQERQERAALRAKEVKEEYPKTTIVKKTLYEIRCENCGRRLKWNAK